jgi:hypothetical protein
MKCSEDQFKNDLKEKLKELGFREHMLTYYFKEHSYEDLYIYLNLETKRYSDFNFIPNLSDYANESLKFDKYNKELLLAIVSMSKEELGIEGEYWKYIHTSDEGFTNNKLYRASGHLNKKRVFIDDNGDKNGFNKTNNNQNTKYFVKATIEEIVEHFTNLKILNEVTPEIMAEKLKAIQELLNN